jgi:hypothetical protein
MAVVLPGAIRRRGVGVCAHRIGHAVRRDRKCVRVQSGRRLSASVHHQGTRLWRAPLFTRCDGLVHAGYYSRRFGCICHLADFPHSTSHRLAKAYIRWDSSSGSASYNSMKICALRSFASLVLTSLAVDHIAIAEDRQLNTAGTTRVAADTAATAEAKAAFVFGGVSYFQRWAQDDQCEFTPTGQENLEKWSDMITINVYPSAHDGDTLAMKANVLENYKSHGGRVLQTDSIPRTPDRPAEHFYRCCFWSIKFSRGGVCPFQISGRHRLVDCLLASPIPRESRRPND